MVIRCSSLLVIVGLASVFLIGLQIPEGVNGQSFPSKDICSAPGYFVSLECPGFYYRCIFRPKINRWLLFRKPCYLDRANNIQYVFDPTSKRCTMPPATTTVPTTDTTTEVTTTPTMTTMTTTDPTATTAATTTGTTMAGGGSTTTSMGSTTVGTTTTPANPRCVRRLALL